MRFVGFLVRSFPLVFIGVVIGLLGRWLLGPPLDPQADRRKFDQPVPKVAPENDGLGNLDQRDG